MEISETAERYIHAVEDTICREDGTGVEAT
jgi:hypothetical protein